MKIKGRNIRATALKEFWGDEYNESVYLWEGAKHELSLREIINHPVPVINDLFSTQEEIQKGHEFCKSFYDKKLPVLARKLNEVHGVNLSASFWQITFGYWLYRHIAIVYEKYCYLKNIEVDSNSIKLLDINSYYIPQNHYDYIYCFACDFGVQQLVSHYYYMYSSKNYERVSKRFACNYIATNTNTRSFELRKNYLATNMEPKVALLSACFTENVFNELRIRSNGLIDDFLLPPFENKTYGLDLQKRGYIAGDCIEECFESYFDQTLYFCLPKDFVEGFRDYHDVFQRDIESLTFSHILSECWISHIPTAIYVALAKENNRRFIAYEHGSGEYFYVNATSFIDIDSSDYYLTVGSKRNRGNVIQGGFSCRDILPYIYAPEKQVILYISRTKFPYWFEFNEWNAVNSTFIKEIRMVSDFIDMMPAKLKPYFMFRPRVEELFWDVEHALELNISGIPVDKGNFAESICNSRLVVIDHISTGIAEILLMDVPFLLVLDIGFIPLLDALTQTFDDLVACGVCHSTPQSAVSHLSSIYDDVQAWWQSEPVRSAVSKLRDISLAPASRTTDYLLSLLTGETMKTSLNKFMRDSDGVFKSPQNQRDFGYSDGTEQEDYVLNTIRSARDLSIFSDELRNGIRDWASEYHFSRERHNLLRHLKLHRDMNILELGCGCGAITRQLGESGARVTAVEGSLQRARSAAARCRDLANVRVHCSNFQDVIFTEKYDLVTLIGVLEYSPQYFDSADPIRECLEIACNALKPDGVLVIAIENQLGLKYFSGYREDHADIPYFGIEDRYNEKTAVTFGRRELRQILNGAGLSQVEFHYPFPDYKVPKAVFTEQAFCDPEFRPEEIIRQLKSRDYAGEITPAFDERLAIPALCRNGVMEDVANSFLVLASRGSGMLEALRDRSLLAAFYATERHKAYNSLTNFVRTGDSVLVRKKLLMPQAPGRSANDVLVHVPSIEKYIAGQNLEAEYRRCLAQDDFNGMSRLLTLQFEFLEREAVATASPANPLMSEIRPEFIDCVPANIILLGDSLHYIDRAWKLRKRVSLGALMLRTVDALHDIDNSMPELSRDNLLQILKQAGYNFGNEIIDEYQSLIGEIEAQVYQGANLGAAPVEEVIGMIRTRLDGMLSRLGYLPKPPHVIERMRSHMEQILLIHDGYETECYLESIADLGAESEDEVELCRSILELLGDDPEWSAASGFIRRLVEEIAPRLNGNASPPCGDDSANPLKHYKQFEYGNEFEGFICPNPFLYVELAQNGDVSCCCYLPFTLGNLHKEEMGDLWNSASALELRRSIQSGEYCYCDRRKCAAMQEAVLPEKKDTFKYQIPYQLIRKGAQHNEPLRDGISSGRLDTSSGPRIISFEDDPSCNLSCPSCRTSVQVLNPEEGESRFDLQRRLLDSMGGQILELWLSGAGDPFASYAYRKLLQQYDFAKYPELKLRLDTNGMLLTEQAWSTVLGKVRDRVKLVAVSVDATTDATYAAIRRGGNFQALLHNLRIVSALPERAKGMGFIIRMIVQNKNFREMKQFVELGRSLGVDGVVFSVIQNWGTFTDEDYREQAVHIPGHPQHKELCAILRDPVFRDPLVDLGNLTQLYREQLGSGRVTAAVISPAEDKPAPRARVIAFYLPQFHPIPENDRWWGKGFTEWTNTGKAIPLYEGHYQPHVPSDLGYYDLRVPETREAQADLARRYGVEAFCYWHYWFAGHRLLERPFDEVVRSGRPDFPFCLGWANQTWSGIWHGAPDRILIEQTYPGLEDYKAHFNALLPAFRDSRYLRVNGKPLFLIYAPQSLPDARLFTDYWQDLALQAGVGGFHFVAHNVRNPEDYGCMTCVDNAPFTTMNAPLMEVLAPEGARLPRIYQYAELVRHLKEYPLADNEHPLVIPNWDNTPRSGANGFLLHGSTPELFRLMMEDAVAKAEQRPDPQERIVFVKAWNEWAEGNHLEPDLRFGHSYLEAVRNSILARA